MTDAFRVVGLTPMRKVIAARMTEAKKTIPHFRLVHETDLTALGDHRAALKRGKPEVSVSINDFFVKACAKALIDVPALNIQWIEGEIHEYVNAHISVIIAIDGGLASPVIRDANTKSVWDISREIKELAAKANASALKMTEVTGGSFSISNLGMYGVDQFDAIINPPQCAILAIGSARRGMAGSSTSKTPTPRPARITLSLGHPAIAGIT